jgi:putative endonuclease
MTIERQAFGKWGEDLAIAELERRGYAIIERRYRTRHGEIDIVARDGDVLVFVEVKARATAQAGTAAEAVTSWKQRRLVRMATDYLARHCAVLPQCRFDVVAIDGTTENQRLTVYPNAFDAC